MKEQIIDVESQDDVASLRDKLRWIRADHVLLVLPDGTDSQVLRNKLDLILVQREASRRGAMLALITRDRVIIELAREVGLPHFFSVEEGRHRQWAAPSKQHGLERPPLDVELSAELVEAGTRLQPPSAVVTPSRRLVLTRRHWILGASLVIVSGALLGPSASIQLQPITNQVTVTAPIVADPHATGIDMQTPSIPARIVGVDVDGTTSTSTTGTLDVPTDKAHGTVVLTNLIPDQVTIPAGSIVHASASQPVRFRTLADVTLPGRVGQNVEVGIEAVLPGVEGNLQSNKINQLEGQLGTRVAVTNGSPTQGGNVKSARAVARQDYDRVRTLAIQLLQQRAYAEMQTDPYIQLLATEFVPVESLTVVLVNAETYSMSVGQAADAISLTMRATVQGTAIDERAARQVVYAKMAQKVGTGFEINPDTLVFKKGVVTAIDGERRLTFVMEGAGDVVAIIDSSEIKRMVAGMRVAEASMKLQQSLPLAAPPKISVWPDFWLLMPVMPFRIEVASHVT